MLETRFRNLSYKYISLSDNLCYKKSVAKKAGSDVQRVPAYGEVRRQYKAVIFKLELYAEAEGGNYGKHRVDPSSKREVVIYKIAVAYHIVAVVNVYYIEIKRPV